MQNEMALSRVVFVTSPVAAHRRAEVVARAAERKSAGDRVYAVARSNRRSQRHVEARVATCRYVSLRSHT